MRRLTILLAIYFVGACFVIYKAYIYCTKRPHGHDCYPVLQNTNGQSLNLDMLGFKFSAILCISLLNFITLFVLYTTNNNKKSCA